MAITSGYLTEKISHTSSGNRSKAEIFMLDFLVFLPMQSYYSTTSCHHLVLCVIRRGGGDDSENTNFIYMCHF